MCCSLINKDRAETVYNSLIPPLFISSKTQTFLPILGVIPAIATVIVGLIACITALALKFFANEKAQERLNTTITVSLVLMGYSIVNIASGGFFAPICEYVTEFLSTNNEGEKFATAGLFDIFPTLRRGESINFFNYYRSSSESASYYSSSSESDSEKS